MNAARPWIEQAHPTYPCVIDQEHRVADLYNMVNVPSAVWISESGLIVRPPEPAGAYEGFRSRDPATGVMPQDIADKTAGAKRTYVEAVKDWARKGAASEYVLAPAQARNRMVTATATIARAHAAFRLGQHLLHIHNTVEGDAFLLLASQLHPDSWNFWRQRAPKDNRGLAATPEFWARVKDLGPKRYYAPVDLKGMPK